MSGLGAGIDSFYEYMLKVCCLSAVAQWRSGTVVQWHTGDWHSGAVVLCSAVVQRLELWTFDYENPG